MKRFKKDAPVYFDYKDVKTLSRYINIYGQIEPISKTGLSAKQQRQLATQLAKPLGVGHGLRRFFGAAEARGAVPFFVCPLVGGEGFVHVLLR